MVNYTCRYDFNNGFIDYNTYEPEYVSIVPPSFNPDTIFAKNITDKTTFFDIYKSDFKSMFLAMDENTKEKISYTIEDFKNLKINKKEEIIARIIHLETGTPEEYVRVRNWFKIEGKWYYFKNKFTTRNINELLGEVISEYFGLDTVHYKLAKLHDNEDIQEGLVSENFCNPNYSYKALPYYLKKFSLNNSDIIKKLRNICPNDEAYKLLLSDIKKLIIRDFSVGQKDRYYHNFLFKENNDTIRLAPLYDYEDSFDKENRWAYESSLIKMNIYEANTIDFLKNDSEFQNLLYLLLDMDINKLIKIVEDRHNITLEDYRTSLYVNYTDSIKELVKTQGLIK